MSNVIPVDISTILDASEPIFIQSIPLHIAVVVGQIIEFGELFMTVSDETGTIRNHISNYFKETRNCSAENNLNIKTIKKALKILIGKYIASASRNDNKSIYG